MTEAAPDGIFVVDSDGHIVLVDRGLEHLLGYARRDLIGLPVEEVILPISQPSDDLHVARCKNGAEIKLEIAHRALSGNTTLVSAFVRTPYDTQSGRRQLLHHRPELVGELTDTVAHEFNNVLTVLRAEVSLLGIDAGLGQSKAVARINNALDRATELARQLVTIGHIARLP